jgi:CheY-like chemotaxis protein
MELRKEALMQEFNAFRLDPNQRKNIEEESDRCRAKSFKPAQVKEQLGSRHHRLYGVCVLLVDDNPGFLYMLKTVIFEKSGAEVITAVSVKDALEALEKYRPDVLISDIEMPSQNGYDLIRQVRSRRTGNGGEIPALALTGSVRECYELALASGFQLCLGKHTAPDELIEIIAKLVGRPWSDLRCA